MISLKDYLLEAEDTFVNTSYITTNNVQLSDPLFKDISNNDEENTDGNNIPVEGGVDIKLAGEIRLYSETSSVFYERKRNIASTFKAKLKDEEINYKRILKTKIFEIYVNHLIQGYKKDVDENCKINISTKEELSRQLANDFVMLLRNMEISNSL